MTKRNMLTFAAVALVILGVYMIYLGTKMNITPVSPPTVTGVGFVIIGAVFYKLR